MDLHLINPVEALSPVLLALLLVEMAFSFLTDKEIYSIKDFLASLSMGLGGYVITAFLKLGSAAYLLQMVFDSIHEKKGDQLFHMMGHEALGWSLITWMFCLLLVDLSHYWVHRLNHTVRIMWAAHVVHHSSEHYNLGTGLRISWIAMLYKPLFYAWIPALGFRPEMILVCISMETVWQYILHTEYCPRLGPLEWILITPRQHRVHHGKNPEYIDKNHGAIFNIFDRLFGTWAAFNPDNPPVYGVTQPPGSFNPITIVLHEYRAIFRDVRSARNLKDVILFVFGPPGWSPDIQKSYRKPTRLPFKQSSKSAIKA